MFGGAFGGGILGGALGDRRASGGFGGSRGGFLGGSGYNPDVVRSGHRLDNKYYLQREGKSWERARQRGLTAQEYYGSGASSSGGPTGGASTLGNMAASSASSSKALLGSAITASANRNVQTRGQDTQLQIAKINADTQLKVAGIKQTTDTRGQDINKVIADNNLAQKKREFNQVTLPQAARIAKKTTAETNKLINEVATSEPKFIRMLKIMTMGTDNTLGLAIQNTLGIDVSDVEQMKNLSPDKRRLLIQGMMAAGSVAAKEIAGGQMTVNQYLNTFVRALEKAGSGISDAFKPGIEKATPPVKSGRGRGYHN